MPAFKRKVSEHHTRLMGYKTHYLKWAAKNSRGTIVCFHGWLDNAASFVPLAEELPEYEIFAWDFLGHGKSAHRHEGDRYHYVDLVPFIDAAVTATLGAHEKKILIGHSMGAGATALYAGALGQNLRNVILIEGFSPMTAEPGDAAKILAEGVRDFKKAEALPKPYYKNFADAVKIRMRINSLTEETAVPLVRRATVKSQKGYTWRADFRLRAPSLVRMSSPQVENILSQISVPTLIILGTEGMPQLRQAAAAREKFFKNAELETLPGHHHLHMDNAATVAQKIQEFLEP